MITVQNDWIEYAPVVARRPAVRGGAVCARRMPLAAARPTPPIGTAKGPAASRPIAHRGARRGPLRLTRRGRVVLVLLPAVIALSSALVSAGAPFAQADTRSAAVVVVQPGDSLWSIAERLAPQRDPRDVIAELERANHLAGALVAAGARLAVPAALAR